MSQSNNDCLSVLCARVASQDQEIAKLRSQNEQLSKILGEQAKHHEETVKLAAKVNSEFCGVPDTPVGQNALTQLLEHLK